MRVALVGNPNCGKTTLFNALTGANQYVGNWPGVTVEKKSGKLKADKSIEITDLPGIYSLSPYTLEEVIARDFLIKEHPDAILNIVDGTNLERNLYLSTQLLEMGIPVVVAVNMMDVVRKRGDQINITALEEKLSCPVVEISALKNEGIDQVVNCLKTIPSTVGIEAMAYSREVEDVLTEIIERFEGSLEYSLKDLKREEEGAIGQVPEHLQRFYAIKLLENDEKIRESLKNPPDVSDIIARIEKHFDDDTESVITNERYTWISSIMHSVRTLGNEDGLTTSDKIDRVVTNRFLALPIFAVVMFLVYYISVSTVGTFATDWANDGVFGDGWHLFGIGSAAYNEVADEWNEASAIVDGYDAYVEENGEPADGVFTYEVEDEETLAVEEVEATVTDYEDAQATLEEIGEEPDPADYGVWVPSIPTLIGDGLEAAGTADWLSGLILDGIVAGVGAVLGFVPQMLVLFLMLAFLEACGYMARIAFVLDRIFRKFGLSGKSFIPMLIGTGCGVPGVMASRTIENERDRRMTIMTTTFIPCGAKVPFIAMIAGAIFNGSAWVATSAYFVGMAAIIVSGIMLKKTKMFSGEPAPFVMELPAYHWPTLGNVLRSMWERGWSFIKKAGTIILLSTIFVWFTTYFGVVDGTFRMLSEEEISYSILAAIGNAIAWIFIPLGWGNWQAAVASITGLVAKENIVGTLGILYASGVGTVYQNLAAAFTSVTAYSFLVFNLLCAPCFAAIGAIKREMNSSKWTWFAIGYQCGFAYICALMVNQFGGLFTGNVNVIGLIVAIAALAGIIYMLAKPYKEATKLSEKL